MVLKDRVSDLTPDDIEEILRTGYRAPIVEGDYWLGMAQHIHHWIKMARNEAVTEFRHDTLSKN